MADEKTSCVLRLFGAQPGQLAGAVGQFLPQWQASAQWKSRGGETLLALQAASPAGLKKAAQSLRARLPDALYGAGDTSLAAAAVDALEHHNKLLVCADAAAGALRTYLAEYRVPGYDEQTGTGLVRHLDVRTNASGQSLLCVVVNGEALPHEDALVSALRRAVPDAVGVVLGVNTRRDNVILGDRYRTLWGRDTLTDTLCGHTFRLSIPSFYQVNRDQAQVLYRRAVDYAGLTGTELVLDLYCGAGTITLTMADKAKKIIGAEIVSAAVENARENAAANGIENAEFFCGDAGDIASKLAAEKLHPDVICVDPPRKGLAPEVIDAMARMGPQRIVYVSCDPATLGRDVKLLAQKGYRLIRATAVDLFPGTAHVETVVLLSRETNPLAAGTIKEACGTSE